MNAGVKRLRVILFMLVILLVAGGLAQAVPITIEITGIVTDIRDLEAYAYDEAILVGDSFTGIYTYDSAAIDSSAQSDIGSYLHNSPYGFDISLGGFEFKTAESHVDQFKISVYNDSSLQPYDRYGVSSSQNDPLSTGLSVNGITWSLYDDTHTALSSTDLSSIAPDINAWSSNTLLISCGGSPGANPTFAVWGTVTQAVVIPEPASVLLFGAGIALLRRRRKQKFIR